MGAKEAMRRRSMMFSEALEEEDDVKAMRVELRQKKVELEASERARKRLAAELARLRADLERTGVDAAVQTDEPWLLFAGETPEPEDMFLNEEAALNDDEVAPEEEEEEEDHHEMPEPQFLEDLAEVLQEEVLQEEVLEAAVLKDEAMVPVVPEAMVPVVPDGFRVEVASKTGSGWAMAFAGVNCDWGRCAVAAEAEHVSRLDDAPGRRVRFHHFDLSAVDPPVDTVRGSNEHAEAVALRLAEVARAGERLAADSNGRDHLAKVATALDDVGRRQLPIVAVDEGQIRGAATLWAAEAWALVNGTPNASPVRAKLSALVSSVLRYHLRRLLNPPPPPGTKAAYLGETTKMKRSPLRDASNDDDTVPTSSTEERGRVMTRAAKQRKKSRRASIVSSVYDEDDEQHPYAWCRSGVHRIVKLQSLEDAGCAGVDGSIASQVTSALGNLITSTAVSTTTTTTTTATSPRTKEDVEEAAKRVDELTVVIHAACGHAFLHKLLTFPRLDAAIRDAGGWGVVEGFARLAATYGDGDMSRFEPFSDVNALTRNLAAGLRESDDRRRSALADLSAIVRAFANKRRLPGAKAIAHTAQLASRSALLYPDLVPNTDE